MLKVPGEFFPLKKCRAIFVEDFRVIMQKLWPLIILDLSYFSVQIFTAYYYNCSMSHSSSRATHRQIAQKFVWPSMAEDIKERVRTCLACQQSKIYRHNHTSSTKIPVSDTRARTYRYRRSSTSI